MGPTRELGGGQEGSALTEYKVVHLIRRWSEVFDAQLVCLADGVKSQKIRLADQVAVMRVPVPRQKRVARCLKSCEARRSRSPSTATTVGSPIMTAATRKYCPKWIAASAIGSRARGSKVRDRVEG